MAEPTTATQSTEPGSQIDPAEAKPAFDVRLTAVRSGAKVLRSGGIEIDVQQAQIADIQEDEGIELVHRDGQQSYSILDFSDYLEVELFSNTNVFLADLQQESTDVTLHLNKGHIFVHPNDQTTSRVTVQTPYASIKTLTAGTEFDVCHNEALTCVLVKRGVVEVTAHRRQELVKTGEAIQILRDQPPSPPICAPTSIFTTWEGRYRQFADAPALEKVLAQVPQEPCPVTTLRLPLDARIFYRNEFTNPASGWARGKIDNFMASYVRYSGRRYYQVQAQGPDKPYLAYVPNQRKYEDVNIDIRAIAEAESDGDFRYGLVFRRSGDQFYAFAISPTTDIWYFLKSSPEGLELLRDGTDERIRGLDTRETLRVESYGSTFLLFINGRFIDWISDPDYASGEVGLFVDSLDNPDALIRFDSILVWDIPPVTLIPDTGGREYCFNARDDDADRLIDRADPDCQRRDPTPTPLPLLNNTLQSAPNTLQPTSTLMPQPTGTPRPPNTATSLPTNTRRPPNTATLPPTSTRRPPNTATSPPTHTPKPTDTRKPPPTHKPPSHTPKPTNPPAPTNTPQPEPTATQEPTEEPTDVPTEEPTDVPTEEPTDVPTVPPIT